MSHKLGIFVCAGLTGSGKTTWLADRSLFLLRDNHRTHKRTGLELRRVASNIRFSKWVEEMYPDGIIYWEDPSELIKLRNVDIIWDELATYLDSTQFANTPLSLKRFLQQHRKYGVCIYGTVQDFPMLDISMRRLVHALRYSVKITGSRDLAANMPPPKRPWGVIFLWTVKREDFIKDASEYRWSNLFMPELIFISKKLTSAYDTTQEIFSGKMPPLKFVPQRTEFYDDENNLVRVGQEWRKK